MLHNTFSSNHFNIQYNYLRVKQRNLELPNFSVQNSINYVTPNEIKIIIKYLPNKKATGYDKITNRMLKKLPPKIILNYYYYIIQFTIVFWIFPR